MTVDDLQNYLQLDDLEFSYNGKRYFICPFLDKGFYSAGEVDASSGEYDSFDGLLDGFVVQGLPLRKILQHIEWR